MFLVRLVLWSEATGVMPANGGLLDQSNFYFEVRNIVVAERNMAEEEIRSEEERQAKLKAAASQQPGGRRGVVKFPRGRR
jgi:hypothetical protein